MDQKSLFKLSYGLYLLTSHDGERDCGRIINTAIQVANDPVRLSIAVIKGGHTHAAIAAKGVFNVSALTTHTPYDVFRRFGMQSGLAVDKFEGFDDVERSSNGLYYLTTANSYLSCKVVGSMDLGSHTLFIGEVTDGVCLSDEESCTYAYYHARIKPAPAPAAKKGWVCSICGYVHEGEEVPDGFVCPICRHSKEDFVPLGTPKPTAQKWVCKVCGYVHQGDTPPARCPVCGVPSERFAPQDEKK